MVRAAVTVGWIAMARPDDRSLQIGDAGNRLVEVVDFEPEEHAVTTSQARISDSAVVMFYFPRVQLKNQPSMRHESLILRTAMITLAAKHALIPAAARLDIGDTD